MDVKANLAERIANTKKFLAAIFEEVPAGGDQIAAGALQSYTTDTGAVLMIDKLETGGKVFQSDGTTPQTAGFTLADGTIVQVGDDGVITAVSAPILAAQPDPAIPPAAPAIPALFDERLSALETEFLEYKQTVEKKFSDEKAAIAEAHKTEVKKLGDAFNEVVALVQKFGAAPSDEPAQTTTTITDDESPSTKAERRAAFAQSIATRKVKV